MTITLFITSIYFLLFHLLFFFFYFEISGNVNFRFYYFMIYPYKNNSKNSNAVYMIIRLTGIYSYTLSQQKKIDQSYDNNAFMR
jgi:hypothetical protein